MYPFQSTSALFHNYPYQSNRDLLLTEDEKSFDGFTSQLQSAISVTPTYPILQPNQAPMNLMTHLVQQNQDFNVPGSLMMNQQVPIYHQTAAHEQYLNYQVIRQILQAQPEPQEPTPIYHQATAHEKYLNYQVIRQILQAQQEPQEPALRQPQRLEINMENGEEVLHVEMERPFLAMGKPRLRWTAALHARFLRAALELGGIHCATPKGILRGMNVRGLTVDQIKSHLQKVRLRNRQGISLEDFMAYGIQADGRADGVARRAARGNGANVQAVRVEAPEPPILLGTYEAPNYHQNLRVAAEVNGLNNFNFANF